MVSDGRYIRSEGHFKRYAREALSSHFADKAHFDQFYQSLHPDAVKDEFLRVTSLYLFLVKRGDWYVNIQGSDRVVDYLTNSFKLVALVSLIESLSAEKYVDFYDWLTRQDQEESFPIPDKRALSSLYQSYKHVHGSIRGCVTFFDRLPPAYKKALCRAIRINGKPLDSVKKVARFLYDLRSKFVHEGRLALHVSESPVTSVRAGIETQLSMDALCEAFEQGVLGHFRSRI
jgi:hypothetical protein